MIKFQKVRFCNFGSFGNNFTEVELDRHQTSLITGLNGHGKSFALLDSITFALFGKPFRKINIPQLVNSLNEKDCLVEVEFSVGDDSYLIRRGLKPKVFEVFKNDDLVNIAAKSKDYQRMLEEQILRMNYKSFTQVVILGSSSFVPFMQLSAADRRAVIEDILDIQVFSNMNVVLRDKTSLVKGEITDINKTLQINKERATGVITLIESLQKKNSQQIESLEEEIKLNREEQDQHTQEIERLDQEIEKALASISDEKDVEIKIKKYETAKSKLERELSNLKKNINFFHDHDSCPMCNSEITHEMKESETKKASGTLEQLKEAIVDLEKIEQKQVDRSNEIADVRKIVRQLSDDRIRENTSRKNAVKAGEKLERKLSEARAEDTTDLDDAKDKLERAKEDREKCIGRKDDLLVKKNTYSNAADMLKDSGIKAKVIKYYLPVINTLINKYLKDMEFFVSFELDENFNETIKSRHRDTFSYMSFSEGEKMRIDLAILLAWREISRLKNSANTNLLILDEVFDASLDAMGSDDFLKLLNKLSEKNHIFVISHKSDQLVDKFANQITFQKHGNFSRLK
jgi:DNA repair exonuclease SbcCD ATPase subunit